MNFQNYRPNVIFIPQQKMKLEDKVQESALLIKASENTEQKLLKELIQNVESFLTNKELRALDSTLKKIFYHGLSLDIHVSNKTFDVTSPFDDSRNATQLIFLVDERARKKIVLSAAVFYIYLDFYCASHFREFRTFDACLAF